MARRGHEPIRTCVVCNGKRPKRELLRLAVDPQGAVVVLDPAKRAEGRGAYVCPECLPRLSFTKRLQKAFRNRASALGQSLLDRE